MADDFQAKWDAIKAKYPPNTSVTDIPELVALIAQNRAEEDAKRKQAETVAGLKMQQDVNAENDIRADKNRAASDFGDAGDFMSDFEKEQLRRKHGSLQPITVEQYKQGIKPEDLPWYKNNLPWYQDAINAAKSWFDKGIDKQTGGYNKKMRDAWEASE